MTNLFVMARSVSWNRIYLQELSIKEVVVRELDIWVFVDHWDKRLRLIPPPLELSAICYKGPAIEHAFIKLTSRLCHAVYYGLELSQKTNEGAGFLYDEYYEAFKDNYGEYFLSQTPFRVFMKKFGVKAPEALERLKAYGWGTADINHKYPDEVEPNWWTSRERSVSAIELRGDPDLSHSLRWDRIMEGDSVELYALVASVKDRYLRHVTSPIMLQGFRAAGVDAGPENLERMIAESQRSTKFVYQTINDKKTLCISRLGMITPIYTQNYVIKPKVKCKNLY